MSREPHCFCIVFRGRLSRYRALGSRLSSAKRETFRAAQITLSFLSIRSDSIRIPFEKQSVQIFAYFDFTLETPDSSQSKTEQSSAELLYYDDSSVASETLIVRRAGRNRGENELNR